MDTSSYVIGIDGGGTQSQAVALDLGGQPLSNVKGGPLNYHLTGIDTFSSNIESLILSIEANHKPALCRKIVVGTATFFDHPHDNALTLLAPLQKRWKQIEFRGDAITAVTAATGGKAGIVIISGTGSIAARVNHQYEATFRGGLGAFLGGDPGSAYWIVCETLRQLQPLTSEQLRRSPIWQRLTKELSLDHADWESTVSKCVSLAQQVEPLAKLSKHLAHHCQDDPLWRSVESETGHALASLGAPLCQAGLSLPVSLMGSVLQSNSNIRQATMAQLQKLSGSPITFKEPLYSPAEGAALLALQSLKRDSTS